MTCIGCERKEALASLDVENLIEEQLFLESQIVPQEILLTRLEICKECPFRVDHTCSKCGCFYKFRASLPQKSCPENRWQKQVE